MHCKRIREVFLSRGVTLVELLVVIAIIAIFAVISIPSFSRAISKSALDRQTDFLAGQIMTTKVRAMELNCQCFMDFNPLSSTYSSFCDKNKNSVQDDDEETFGPFRLESGVGYGFSGNSGPNNTEVPDDGISFVNNRLIFNMQGSSTAGTVYLTKEDRAFALRVLPASGTTICWIYEGGWRKK
jgi:prepilin-type N-terminal cleavage/methylation domain-containing protein